MQKIMKCRKYITILPRQFFRFSCLPHHETPLRNRTTTSLSASKKSPTYAFFGNQPEENIYIKKDQSKCWLNVREIKRRKNNKLNWMDFQNELYAIITFSKRRENYYTPPLPGSNLRVVPGNDIIMEIGCKWVYSQVCLPFSAEFL